MPSQYPTALDTTTTLSTAVNGLSTTLNGDHTSGATTITVASTSGAAAAGFVTIDSEVVRYTGLTPTTLTGCTRGADSTAAASHSNGSTVKFGLVADHHNSLVTGLIAVQTKLGLNTNGASASSIDAAQLAAGSSASIASLTTSGTINATGLLTGNGLRDSRSNIAGATVLTKIDENAPSGTSFSFTGINQNFHHLIVVWTARLSGAVANANCVLQFNSDGGANYIWQNFVANGTTTSATVSAGQTGITWGNVVGATAPANYPSSGQFTIPDYSGTTFYKTMFSTHMMQYGATTSQQLGVYSGDWGNSAAITAITIYSGSGSFMAGSLFTLYGLP